LPYVQWHSSNIHRRTTMGMFPKFLVRMSELMVALTLKINAM
jgi:hypothetical protein